MWDRQRPVKLHNPPIKLHYVWIGTPTTQALLKEAPAAKASASSSSSSLVTPPTAASSVHGIPGHDTQAVFLTAKKIDPRTHRILFWCLDEHAALYSNLFENYPVIVRSIKHYLASDFKNAELTRAACNVSKTMENLLAPSRNQIRDRVTIKNMISLFLLAAEGDYYFDSNVRPAENNPLQLTRFSHFCAPYCIPPNNTKGNVDVWALYSPPYHRKPVLDALNEFHSELSQIETTMQPYEEKYYQQMGDLIVNVVKKACSHFWKAIYASNEDCYITDLPVLGMRKYYFNTHKHKKRFTYETDHTLALQHFSRESSVPLNCLSNAMKFLIFEYFGSDDKKALAIRNTQERYGDLHHAVCFNYPSRLKELIENFGVDINQQGNFDIWQRGTALHFAVICNNHDSFKYLLQRGANVKMEVVNTVTAKSYPVLDLINGIPYTNLRNAFLQTYQHYYPPQTNSSCLKI